MATNYDDFYKSVEEKAKALKEQANAFAKKQKDIINAQYDKVNQLQEEAIKSQQEAAQNQYSSLYDANVVNEMIARKNAEEAISNMGLKDSGLNQTNQTAISIARGNADASVRLQLQAQVDSLSSVLAQYKAENDIARSEAIATVELKNAETLASIEQNALTLGGTSNEFDQERYDKNYKYALDFNSNPNNNRYGFELQVDSLGNLLKVPTVLTTDEYGNPLNQEKIYIGNTTTERNNNIELFAVYANETPEKKKTIIRNTLIENGVVSSMTDEELYAWIANQYPLDQAVAIVDALGLKAPNIDYTWSQPAPWGNSYIPPMYSTQMVRNEGLTNKE